MSIESDTQGMYLQPTTRMVTMAEMNPFQLLGRRTNFLRHLGPEVEKFYKEERDIVINTYPQQRIHFVIIGGRTATGKKTARAQFEDMAMNDHYFHDELAKKGGMLGVVDLPFSHAVDLAMLTGEMSPDTPRGLFSPAEYQRGSKILTRYVLGELNNFPLESDDPKVTTLAVVEPSGPTAYIDELNQTLEGWDRGFSTVYQLSKLCRDITRVLVITRGPDLLKKILKDRKKLPPNATAEQVKEFILTAPLEIIRKGKPADIREWSEEDLLNLGAELVASHASAAGALVSNQQTDWLMRERYHTTKENEFWPKLRDELRFAPADWVIALNRPSKKRFVLAQDVLDNNNPMIEEIRMRERLLGQAA